MLTLDVGLTLIIVAHDIISSDYNFDLVRTNMEGEGARVVEAGWHSSGWA